MTAVFFLFLFHLSLGILATLVLVPDRAGRGFFKFCSAAAVFMTTGGLWLLVRRYGLEGGRGVGAGPAYRIVLAATAVSLLAAVVYNRAWHFGWQRLKAPLLAASLAFGTAAVLAGGAPPTAMVGTGAAAAAMAGTGTAGQRVLMAATDLTSIVLLGAAASAMILGHYYLIVLDLPISALRRLTVLLLVGLVLRAVVVGTAIAGPTHAGYEGAAQIASGLWSPDGIFVWMRLLFGIAGPFVLIGFIWKTVEIRSTQSATGILYVQLFLVLSGELLAKYLRVAAGMPL